jgi:hypothetical protein
MVITFLKKEFTVFLKLILTLVFLFFSCMSYADEPVEISFAHNANDEIQTGEQLKGLFKKYDLSKWIVTKNIIIDNDSIPHSHPVLTLHTRHKRDDELLLSTFIHEQMHWYLVQHQQATTAAVIELKKLYPDTPVGFPEGSNTEEGNYEHLLVIDLEWKADRELFGELTARQIMEFWAGDHYTWIYRTVLDHRRKIDHILDAHNLVPSK